MKGSNTRSNVKNGHRRTNSKYGNDKFAPLIAKSVGLKVTVTTATDKITGTLLSFNSPEMVILSLKNENVPPKLTLQVKDLLDFEVDEPTFKTDADISHGQYKERELQRWVPDDADLHNPILNLQDDKHSRGWDQFKVNEDKFGVESTYDEHLYTTRIDTSAPDYLEKVRKADKIAHEIENSSTKDSHILEERGIVVDDSGVDEEDKYSGVDRREDAPVDRRGDDIMAALRNTNLSDKYLPEQEPVKAPAGKYSTPRQRAAEYHNDPAIVSSSATKKKPAQEQQPQVTPQSVPQPPMIKSTKPDSIPPKPPVTQQQHNESFRLNAQSEINSLREFSANFKIPHKIPTDLLPILSKDKIKQDEILKKQVDEPQQLPHQPQQQLQQPRKKFDASRPAFKLNPKAAAFTPGNLQSPQPPKVNYHRSPNNPSPQMINTRPYSSGISNGNSTTGSAPKRHYQISPADFFGGASKIPSKASQNEKIKQFNIAFNFFTTTKKKHGDSKTPVVFEKAFQTPPTWTSNVDEECDKLFPAISSVNRSGSIGMPTSPFVPGASMMGNAPSPNIPAGYPNPNSSNYALSPQQQQQQQQAAMAAHYQQQQFHAAMMYQQQQFQGVPPGQMPMPMYGGEPPFMPPGAFIPPPGGFVGGQVNGNMMGQGGYNNNYNNHHSGGRRYNNNHQSKRGGHS